MSWMYVFPAFTAVLYSTSSPSDFTYLIDLSFFLTLAMFVLAVSFIGRNGSGGYRDRPLPFFLVSLAAAAIIVYSFLLTPLNWFAVDGRQASFLLSTSPALFGFVYCMFFPVFVGWALGLATRAAIAMVVKLLSSPTDRSGTGE